MRKIGFVVLMVLLTTGAPAQDSVEVNLNGIDYAAKAKRQRTAGWVMTGIGTGGLLATLFADAAQSVGGAFVYIITFGGVEPEKKSFTVPYLLSGGVLLAGIVQFANAQSSRRKSGDVSTFFRTESTEVLQGSRTQRQVIPVAGVRLRL